MKSKVTKNTLDWIKRGKFFVNPKDAKARVIESIVEWFRRAKPFPESKDIKVQLGCHFEEVFEMLDEMYSHDPETQFQIQTARRAMKNLAEYFKNDSSINFQIKDEVKFFDSLLDQIVTAIGVGTLKNLDMLEGLVIVSKSNWSKFVGGKPVIRPDGKIGKGLYYEPPSLSHLVK